MQISSGGHFEIQYGGHKERISSGPISENVHNILMYICAKFGACITKCTIHVNVWAKPLHYRAGATAQPVIKQLAPIIRFIYFKTHCFIRKTVLVDVAFYSPEGEYCEYSMGQKRPSRLRL